MTDYRKELTGLAAYFADPSMKNSVKHKRMVRKLAELGEKMATEMPHNAAPRVWWSAIKNSFYYIGSEVGVNRFLVDHDSVIPSMLPDDAEELVTDNAAQELLAANADWITAHAELAKLVGLRPDQNASQVRNRVQEIVSKQHFDERQIETHQKTIKSLETRNAELLNSFNQLQASLHERCATEETHPVHMWLTPKGHVSACDGKELDSDNAYEYYEDHDEY